MLQYPALNPIAFSLGPLKVHWYGIMYLLSFLVGWALARYRAKRTPNWHAEQINDLLFYIILGVILGGRLGYVIFYDFSYYFHNPLLIFAVWDGGMSFHGGAIGVILSCWWWSHRQGKNLFAVTDFIAPIVPIGLGAGRIGNFINGELWGRVTTVPWGMVYPRAGPLPRHPSEIYEFLLEGVVLFTILWLYSRQPRPRMAISGLFLLLYGCFRFFVEFFRQPDPQLGFVAFGWMTRGQELSLPMIVLGVILMFFAYSRHYRNRKGQNSHGS